jgi:hypothetical protein
MNRFPALLSMVLALGVSPLWAGSAAEAVDVSGAYARAVPPGQPNGAVFMEVTNGGGEAHALVAAESPVAETVELHSHRMEEGMMRMRREERIDLPPGETVAFAPGGLHLMLIGLNRQLEPGQQLDLTLIFEDGSRTRVEAPVRAIEAGTGGGKEMRCGSGRCGGGK